MFTIIGAMAEFESPLISERVQAGMQAAKEERTHVGRPPTPDETIQEIERLAGETDLSIRKIKKALKKTRNEDVSRSVNTTNPKFQKLRHRIIEDLQGEHVEKRVTFVDIQDE